MRGRCAIISLVALLLPFTGKGDVLPLPPKDTPTIEALISLHKLVKKEEAAANVRLTAIYGEQSVVTKTSEKVREIRQTVNSKMNNAYSYVLLASSLSSTSLSLYKLIDDYGDFAVQVGKTVKDKPFVAWYFTQSQNALAREIKLMKKLILKLSATEINVLKSSMDEKLNLLLTVQGHIDYSRHIISNARLYCNLMTSTSWHPDYFYEILNSDMTKEIANKVIEKWKSGK